MQVNQLVKKVKKQKVTAMTNVQIFLIILMIPVVLVICNMAYNAWDNLKHLPFIEELIDSKSEAELLMEGFDVAIPVEYIPIYKAAAEKYDIPWPLLAAHHRIETRFSTTKSQVSSVGAEGPMQFMPCTFVGWDHPSCSHLGKGKISDDEKTNPTVISKYGGYGVDGNGDGKADPYNMYDAIYSAANYLSQSGAKNGQIAKAIFHYNHSYDYVADVLYYYELYSSYESELVALVD